MKDVNGYIVTDERWYGKERFLNKMSNYGIRLVFVMTDHLLTFHTFVAESCT